MNFSIEWVGDLASLYGHLSTKHALRDEMREGRREQYAYRQENDAATTPSLVQPGELDEEVRKVCGAVGDVGEDGQEKHAEREIK